MKSKTYWEKAVSGKGPFNVPKRLSHGLAAVARKFAQSAPPKQAIKYIWIYVTEEGLQRRAAESDAALRLDDWLNVVDESASLGAEWMVIYAGACLERCPEVWHICHWAQDEHGLRVGIHVDTPELCEGDIGRLLQLDRDKTYLIVESRLLDAYRPLEERGLRVCAADVRPEERLSPCPNPEAIACVGIDGRLFTCGLVLGDKDFHLGNVLEHGLARVMADASLPHSVPESVAYHDHGCDGCPPHMAKRVAEALPE